MQLQIDSIRPKAVLAAFHFPGVRPNTQAERVLWLLADGRPRRISRIAEELNVSPEFLAVLRCRLRKQGYMIANHLSLYSWDGKRCLTN